MITAEYNPTFEEGAIAFRYTSAGTLQAWKVFAVRFNKGQKEYRLYRDSFKRWESASNLLTGWEPDFPGYDSVDWGGLHYLPSQMDADKDCSEADEQEFDQESYWLEVGEQYEAS